MSRVALVAIVSFIALLSLISADALSQTVSSNVEGDVAGTLSSNPQGPSNSPVSSALDFPDAVTLDFSGDGLGRATQRPDGVGAVLADALFANGGSQNSVSARTLWTQSDTNDLPNPVPYDFEYLITPGSLRIGDFAGLQDTSSQRPEISYEIYIRANGALVFSSTATLIGGSVSHVLNETGTSLVPTFVGGGSVFGYDFQSRFDVIDLGMVPSGATITVEYEMIVTVDTPGFEAGGRAQIGDPFDLDGSPGFVGALRADGVVSNADSSWGAVKSRFR